MIVIFGVNTDTLRATERTFAKNSLAVEMGGVLLRHQRAKINEILGFIVCTVMLNEYGTLT